MTKIYVTPDGREVEIPADLAARTKWKVDGTPDRRLKANAEFVEWADMQDADSNKKADGVMKPGPNLAQAYAMRVWAGQSEDAPRDWRIERVKQALEGQNMQFEGVVLP